MFFKNCVAIIAVTLAISACYHLPSNKETKHCFAKNVAWSVLHQKCVNLAQVADIIFYNDGGQVFVILSEDRQLAEVFSHGLPQPTLLEAVKGGYISKDRTIRLQNTVTGWRLVKSF